MVGTLVTGLHGLQQSVLQSARLHQVGVQVKAHGAMAGEATVGQEVLEVQVDLVLGEPRLVALLALALLLGRHGQPAGVHSQAGLDYGLAVRAQLLRLRLRQ